MSVRINRGIGAGRLVVVLVIVLSVLAVAGLYVWSRMELFLPQQETAETRNAPRQPIAGSARPEASLTLMVYYPQAGALVAAPAGVGHQPHTQSLAKEAVSAVLRMQKTDRAAVLRDVQLRAFYLDSAGTAYVDLSPLTPDHDVRGSAWDELLALYAVVNTLTDNFEEIKSVRFLVSGKEAQTLAGHIDISGHFERRTDLVRQ